ncbi:MAG TPA: hypothetical protein VFI91_01250 [Longimicrobiaceae bacterium]|nr:hypothetical protein [Longimicrobiaceae bacterium]
MCILCDNTILELLTTPLEQLAPGRLADAIRDSRAAAGPGVLDYAEAVLAGEAPPVFEAALYAEIIVSRALEAGVLSSADAFAWGSQLEAQTGLADPRVQAFVSSCAEIIDEYQAVLAERLQVVDRFVESHGDSVVFGGLGRDGELWFDYRDESYATFTEVEAMEIVEAELSQGLHSIQPEILLRYTSLPEAGLEVLTSIQSRPAEVANSLLTGIIDVPALADDRVRTEGYGQFFPDEAGQPMEALRFGEWIILRREI